MTPNKRNWRNEREFLLFQSFDVPQWHLTKDPSICSRFSRFSCLEIYVS
jgi:hypothetical protein